MGMDLAPVSSRVHAESAGVAAQERDYGHTHPLVDHSYPTPEEHHVDVAAAKAELARVTSGNTTRTRRSSNATALGDSDKATPNTDIEKLAAGDGSGDDYEPFDLREWLGTIQPEAAQVGWKKKSLGVSWHDLAVRAANSTDMNVPTIPSMALFELIGPFLDISKMLGYDPFAPKERHILQNFNGCARPGEMVLVIGRPGSGCSTFLQTIANRREGFIGVDGDVSYGGIGAKEMNKHYQGEVVYSEEDDNHLATLTVGRTLDFALRLKSHRTPLPGYTKKEHRAMMRDTLLKTVNIAHTKDTLVGSATVRGVSGGERKRVSILEVLTAGASVMAWDNSTRGLDASTALDYAKSIRILTDMTRTTSFVTVYQASEGIFNQCDKVLVIDEGRCMYFGPRDEARQYFIDLGYLDRPRSTSADWITSCTDPQTRAFAEGVDPKSVPTTSEAMEQAFMESDVHKRMMLDRDDYDAQVQAELKVNQDEFRQAVKDQKHRGVGKRSKYVVSYPLQIWALFARSMQMQIGDPFDIFMSYMTSITIALISGGMFFKQPDLTSGIFTRGGALFNLLLFNSLTSFSELPVQMLGRPILARQTSFAFYRPSASFVSGLMADMPFGIPRVTIFIIILYFMAGLRLSAGAFFTSWLTVIVSYYAFRALFSFFGVISRNFFGAARLAAVIISMLVLWAGYVMPQNKMPRWNYWVSYLNPVYYAFSAMMINEFKGKTFQCSGAQLVPSGPGYPTELTENQVCSVAGATPGSGSVDGLTYLKAQFQYTEGQLWRNIGILFAFLAGFVAMGCIAVEVQNQGSFAAALTVTKPPSKDEKARDDRLRARKEARMNGEKGDDTRLDVEGQAFTWSNLKYTVPVKGGHRVLLDSVDGFVRPGTMTALMGSSGAGKTTLLDVLADRKTIGVIEGDRLIEGKAIDLSFQRQCGYAEQQDIHEPMCSVREAFRFSAYLRQSADVPKEDKDQYVEDIIEMLELNDLADAIIGYPGFGLGVGDRKRVTIGVELAAKPSMLCFLDEPTSGLDGQSAYTICRLLRKLADSGMTILCTIHQPSAMLFEQFDRLLLLQRGGQVVYFGPIGHDACHILDYFATRGAPAPADANPAEFMLDAIGAGSQPRMGPKDWAEWYKESDLLQDNLRQIAEINAEGAAKPVPNVKTRAYAASFKTQFVVVLQRTVRSTWRQPSYQYTRISQHLAFAILTGFLMLRLGHTVETLQYRVFALFMLAVIPAIIISQVMPFWITNRSVWIREETSKTFSGTVFALTQLIAEIPYGIACGLVFFLLIYYMVGFNPSSNHAGFFFVMSLMTEAFSVTVGAMIASFCPSIYIAQLFVPFLTLILSLTCGVMVPANQMTNRIFSKFLYNVNPIRFLISSLITNEFHNQKVHCTDSEFAVFNPPANQTCGQWMDAYISRAGGYLADPSATSDCHFCSLSVGDQYFVPIGMTAGNRAPYFGYTCAFVAFNVVACILFTKYLRFSNR